MVSLCSFAWFWRRSCPVKGEFSSPPLPSACSDWLSFLPSGYRCNHTTETSASTQNAKNTAGGQKQVHLCDIWLELFHSQDFLKTWTMTSNLKFKITEIRSCLRFWVDAFAIDFLQWGFVLELSHSQSWLLTCRWQHPISRSQVGGTKHQQTKDMQ